MLFGFAGARPPVHMAVEREPFVISAVLVWGGGYLPSLNAYLVHKVVGGFIKPAI